MKITYRYIEGYDKKYIVSNFGDVITLKRKKPIIMKKHLDSFGYPRIGLSKNGKQKTIRIHVLVGNAFVGKRINALTFDHIDICKTNNRADNLRLATRSEQRINQNMRINNTSGERNICIIRTGNYVGYRIKIMRNGKQAFKKLNMKTHTMADAVKYRDEQMELLSSI
tara:strand:+ start:162 stop:665 length:504 start_codon:yes stop_codon:yes gene_type:complete